MECPLTVYKIEGVDFSCEDTTHGCFYYSKACTGSLAGLPCTVKQIDKSLLNATASHDVIQRYADYCSKIFTLRHPHIVLFLGLSYKTPASVALVTELLPITLDQVLKVYNRLPDEIHYSLLRDVSLALAYLHSLDPNISHGELCANNVLLTGDMTAKLSDIAIPFVLQLSPAERKRVGALAHLAPELLLDSAKLSTKIDCFAFGALVVHILSGKYPESLSCDPNADHPLDGVNTEHPLASLALHCLSKVPELRPTSAQIVTMVTELMLQFPSPSFERRVELLNRAMKVNQSRKSSSDKPRSVERKDSIITLSNSIEIEHLKLQIEELQVENRGLRTSIKKQANVISARDQEMAAKLMAKDQEIVSIQQEMGALESSLSSYKATIAVKESSLSGLGNQLKHLQEYIASKHEAHLLSPQAKFHWKQLSGLPQAMIFAQAVRVGGVVYFGSGTTTMSEGERCKMFSYHLATDQWKSVDNCPVVGFGMSNFMDQLTLVGGAYESTGEADGKVPYSLTGDVHTFDDSTGDYDTSLPGMPTPRLLPTLITYSSTLIACGGVVLDDKHDICVRSVEVYSSENSQWYRAEPLPLAVTGMSYATIHNHCYLLGGFTDTDFDHPTKRVFGVPLQRLVEEALTHSRGFASSGASALDSPTPNLWQRVPDAPRYAATATTIGGCLVAVGGSDESLEHKSGALHAYSPLSHEWLRMDDIPVKCFSCAVVRLPGSELALIGGMGEDDEEPLMTVYKGRLTLD